MLLLRSLFVLLVVLLGPSKMIAQVCVSQIVLSGESAPGVANADFAGFNFPTVNASGDVAFWAELSTQPGTEAIFGPTSGAGSPLGMLAITGATAPGTGGEVFDFFFEEAPPAINASGDVAFGACLLNNESGVWGPTSGAGSPLGLIAIANTPAPGVTDGADFLFLGAPVSLNESGDVTFLAILQTGTGPPVDPSNWAAIFGPTSGAGSPLGVIAREDTPAPGVDDGAEFDFFFTPAINTSGDAAFLAGVRTGTGPVVNSSNNQAIFGPTSGPGSPLGLIARESEPAPGVTNGAVFGGFDSPAINTSGDVVFFGLLRTGTGAGTEINEAIFGPASGAGSSLGLIAREDIPAPGLSDGAEFAGFSFPSINASGDIAFVGELQTGMGPVVNGSNNGALFTSVAGQLQCILREGDLITVTLPDGSGTEERTVGFIELSQAGLNDAGTLAFRLFFTDGTEGIFTADVSKILGDIDGDGAVTLLDVGPFVDLITGAADFNCAGDFTGDGAVTLLDVAPFVDSIGG